MPDQKPKFYLTTPIYYVNARPHIGHAYTTIVADVVARRHRLLGEDVFFLTGTDEHGQKIERSAAAAGIPPQQFTDQVAKSFADLWARMGITHNKFIRTTDPAHKRGAQKLFQTLFDRGFIELRSYTGTYCVSCEAFVDLPVGTPCPDCGRPLETITEENFFFKLSEFQEQLINLIESRTLEIEPEARRNEVLSFLRGNTSEVFNKYRQDAVMRSIETKSEAEAQLTDDIFVPTEKYTTEAMHVLVETGALGVSKENYYVPGALKDLSISRTSFKWGIPVPNNDKHVIYVWLDALTNYMTAVGYGSDAPADIAQFEKYWPADLHLVGKEIIRFHCVYWPAFLLAANLPLPKKIQAHGWLLFEESKMSKSRGNIVRTETILDGFGPLCPPSPRPVTPELVIPGGARNLSISSTPQPALLKGTASAVPQTTPVEGAALATEVTSSPEPPTKAEQDLFASDVLRYFLLREIPFGQDGSFSFDALITRYNADLSNGYGNLVSRTLKLIEQSMPTGVGVPTQPFRFQDVYTGFVRPKGGEAESGTAAIIREIEEFIADINKFSWPNYQFQLLLAGTMHRIGLIDGYISFHKPWNLAKSGESESREKLIEVLYTAAESIRIITVLLYPFLPYAAASVWAQLGLGNIEEAAASGKLKNLQWGGLKPSRPLGPLSPIFPRADKGLAQIMTDMESPTPKESEKAPASTAPHAGPRTASLPEVNPGAKVAGSHALTTERPATPSHTEVPAATGRQELTSETPQITIDDFTKIDLRVAQIVVAERIPKADKLLRLEVDLGTERRQILSGIAEWYTPEELIGRRIAIIANLAPRKMRGLESHGMLLAASGEDHTSKPILATFSDEVPLGSRIR